MSDVRFSPAHFSIGRPQLRLGPGKTHHAALVPTDGLSVPDGRHLDLQGLNNQSERAMGILKANGWMPWARGGSR